MCLAIEEMKKEAAKEAETKTRTTTLLSVIKTHIEKMGWTAEQSMDMLDIAESDRQQLSEMLS